MRLKTVFVPLLIASAVAAGDAGAASAHFAEAAGQTLTPEETQEAALYRKLEACVDKGIALVQYRYNLGGYESRAEAEEAALAVETVCEKQAEYAVDRANKFMEELAVKYGADAEEVWNNTFPTPEGP